MIKRKKNSSGEFIFLWGLPEKCRTVRKKRRELEGSCELGEEKLIRGEEGEKERKNVVAAS